MKKLFFMLITLFVIYLGIQFGFNFFRKGDNNTYIIEEGNMSFEILESSNFTDKNNNYTYTINAEDSTFKFQINKDFNKDSQVITKIKYYKDNVNECILPIFRDNTVVIDMICYDNNQLTYYYNIKGKNKNLDEYILTIEEYNIYNFADNVQTEKIEGLGIYRENLIKNHYLGINNYKGIFDISSNFNSVVYDITLFGKDVYNQKVATIVDNYYIAADYNQKLEFNKFNVVDLVRLDTYTISSDTPISLDSYIQGVVDGKVYLYDKDNKTQYEINVSKKSIVAYSGNSLKYYKDGVWTTMTLAEANEGLMFTYDTNQLVDELYDRIDKVGQEVGYYYLYKKNGNKYDVYGMNIQDKESNIYLFNTETIDNIYYIDNYIYFVNNNKVQVFSHEFGVKNLVQYNELQFNKNLNIFVYSK